VPGDLSTRLARRQRAVGARLVRPDALADMMRAVNATLEPESVAELLLDRAVGWMPAPSWGVVASDPSAQLRLLAERNLGSSITPAVYGIATWIVQHGQELFTRNLREDYRVPGHLEATVIAFPLTCRGRTLGALIGLDQAASTREPRIAAPVLAATRLLLEAGALALDNALHLKRAEALSVTDDLTNLYNSRYLNQVLRQETKRAARNGRPLSLLFVDLDGFKSINDSFGHLSGSRALVEAASLIRAGARETDIVARFGGDEFALVLPDTGCDGALAVARRIRERIAAHTFLSSEHLEIRLTASVGIATLPEVAVSPEELVQAADKAMYKVKEQGKNGIRVATAADSRDEPARHGRPGGGEGAAR
jgi:diguanylate cyclase (GGDEF)-like protein